MIHPETGEVLETREQYLAAMAWLDDQLGPIYQRLRPLREEYAERFQPADQPPARSRTQVQERVARCPRCGATSEPICPDCGIPQVYCQRVSSNPAHCWRWDQEKMRGEASP